MKAFLFAVATAIVVGICILPVIPNADATPCARNPAACQ